VLKLPLGKAGPKESICYGSWNCCWALFVPLGQRPGSRSLSVTGLETAYKIFRDIPVCRVVLALVFWCSEPAQSMPPPLKGRRQHQGVRPFISWLVPYVFPIFPYVFRMISFSSLSFPYYAPITSFLLFLVMSLLFPAFFPIVSLLFLYCVPNISLSFPKVFPTTSLWFLYVFPIFVTILFPYYFRIISLLFRYVFPSFSIWFP
jgi:hypothetical protein